MYVTLRNGFTLKAKNHDVMTLHEICYNTVYGRIQKRVSRLFTEYRRQQDPGPIKNTAKPTVGYSSKFGDQSATPKSATVGAMRHMDIKPCHFTTIPCQNDVCRGDVIQSGIHVHVLLATRPVTLEIPRDFLLVGRERVDGLH